MKFLQSAGDFPCMVELGGKVPSWELARWGRDRLSFRPLEDDGYTLRGNSRYVRYRGDKQSHRFTLLDGEKFEYDCILNKEPDSNTVYIQIDGWENFDFLRQPDTMGPEILRGSYAVYKKEGIVNTRKYHVGTGKMCHIHRPLIMDSGGREVWGDLAIDKGIMALTIPEKWLGEAKYPVIVDPVFGSSTVGAYYQFPYLSQKYYEEYLKKINQGYAEDINDWIELKDMDMDESILLNKITPDITLRGTVTTRIYTERSDNRWMKFDTFMGCPMVYSDYENQPKYYLFDSMNLVACYVDTVTPKGWRTTTMKLRGQITANTNIWFGFIGFNDITVRFDYGGEISARYHDLACDWEYLNDDVYAALNERGLDDLSGVPIKYLFDPADCDYNGLPGARFDYKISQYLEIQVENYTRTLTEGVSLSDSRKLNGGYKRTTTQTAKGTSVVTRLEGFYRKCVMNAENTTLVKREPVFVRAVVEVIKAAMSTCNSLGARRNVEDNIFIEDGTLRIQRLYRNILNLIHAGDGVKFPVFVKRLVNDWLNTMDNTGQWGEYVRGLYEEAGNISETTHRGNYYRKQEDTAYSEGVSLRHLFVFLRITTLSLVRDYLLPRFLRSRDEIVLKSPVTREVEIESRIQ